ncbi:MAG: zinc ribbon domain-containing protein [Methanosphaera sp.]|nr:zinc ribbon domain-containing protein [Methanobrevibacter sp.]MBQ2962602.1 hypothetical protein [Methanobrevibacter sp.]MEE3325179.1 zinc ribbon domain-containing protein [Methanosphaera sp.]
MEECPYCGKLINPIELICPYCGGNVGWYFYPDEEDY